MSTTLRAFHGDPAIKAEYLARVRAHREADQIIHGRYWGRDTDGVYRGCAVGCTIHGDDHGAYERELGIPWALASFQDGLFERLPIEDARLFPEQFLDAIPVGADLGLIVARAVIWTLSDPHYGVSQWLTDAAAQPMKGRILGLYQRVIDGNPPTESEWDAAAQAYAARAADARAAYAWAAYARAASARAASARAASAWVAYASATSARAEFDRALRDHLLRLLREAPVPAVTP